MPSADCLVSPALPRDRQRSPREGRRLDLDVVRGRRDRPRAGLALQRRAERQRRSLDALTWPGRQFGWAGVDLFFVLSGFLAGPAGPHEQARTGRFDGRRFTARRLLQALAGALRLPRRPGARRAGAVGVLPVAERPARAELRRDVADPPLVARGRGALLPRARRALPAVRPPPGLRRACSPRSSSACWSPRWPLRGLGRRAGVSDVRLQWRTHFRVDSLAAGVLLAAGAACTGRRASSGSQRQRRLLRSAVTRASASRYLAVVGKHGALGQHGRLHGRLPDRRPPCSCWSHGRAMGAARRAGVSRARWPMLGRYSYGIYIWHVFAAQLVAGAAAGLDSESHAGPGPGWCKYGAAIAVGVLATVLVEKPGAAAARPAAAGHGPAGPPAATAARRRSPPPTASGAALRRGLSLSSGGGCPPAGRRRRRARRSRPAARSARPAG